MKWSELSSPEIGALDRDIPLVLNLGAVEQHGPHLPLKTDAFIGRHFLEHIDAAMDTDVLILPAVEVCCSAHHMSFPGTLSVRHETLQRYVADIVESVLHHGFWKLVIFNSHGGNLAIGQVMLETFGHRWPEARFFLFTWWQLAATALRAIQESGPGGVGHACEFETSLLLHADPGSVRRDLIEDPGNPATFAWAEADMLRAPQGSFARNMAQISGGSGVVGRPDMASAEKGRRITEAVMSNLLPMLADVRRLNAQGGERVSAVQRTEP